MKRMICLLIAAALLLSTALAAELPLRELSEVRGRFMVNPFAVKDIGDPMVVPAGEEYLVFATGGPIGFNVWRSRDLLTFSKEKALKKIAWASGDNWAPEVFPWDGRWVMLFTARRSADQSLRIGIAFADEPQGPYEDPLGAPLFDFGYAAIDGTLVTDEAGTPYLIYSRDCSENVVGSYHESHLYGVQLAPDLLSTVGEAVLLTQPDSAWETASGDYRWNEGPAVVKHDGKYYLYYSANYYAGKDYSVGVAAADHPLGPYVKQANNPILTAQTAGDKVLVSGPGHNQFFTVGEELFTAYHTHTYPQAPSGNRQLCIDRAGFHADGTAYINGPTLAKQLKPLSDLGLTNHAPAAAADAALTDGDYCIAPASAAWLWEGTEASLTWDAPVTADMLLIYPAPGTAISGEVILNGELTAAFASAQAPQPGEPLILAFEPVQLSALKLSFDAPVQLGEVLVIGE